MMRYIFVNPLASTMGHFEIYFYIEEYCVDTKVILVRVKGWKLKNESFTNIVYKDAQWSEITTFIIFNKYIADQLQ